MDDFHESMDAKLWAEAFVQRAKADPGFATDEGNMLGWFANAIMRGYDTARDRYETERADPGGGRPAIPSAGGVDEEKSIAPEESWRRGYEAGREAGIAEGRLRVEEAATTTPRLAIFQHAAFHLVRREDHKARAIAGGRSYNDSLLWQFQDGAWAALYGLAEEQYPDLLPVLNEQLRLREAGQHAAAVEAAGRVLHG